MEQALTPIERRAARAVKMRKLDETIGRNIQTRREAMGMSRSKLAEAIGATRNRIYYYEEEFAGPGKVELVEMADVFGCTVDELMREPEGASV